MVGGVVRGTKKKSRYGVVNRLAEIRVERNIARIDLAEHVGYHVMVIGRYERGESTPSLQRLVDWCDALGLELALRPKEP